MPNYTLQPLNIKPLLVSSEYSKNKEKKPFYMLMGTISKECSFIRLGTVSAY